MLVSYSEHLSFLLYGNHGIAQTAYGCAAISFYDNGVYTPYQVRCWDLYMLVYGCAAHRVDGRTVDRCFVGTITRVGRSGRTGRFRKPEMNVVAAGNGRCREREIVICAAGLGITRTRVFYGV